MGWRQFIEKNNQYIDFETSFCFCWRSEVIRPPMDLSESIFVSRNLPLKTDNLLILLILLIYLYLSFPLKKINGFS